MCVLSRPDPASRAPGSAVLVAIELPCRRKTGAESRASCTRSADPYSRLLHPHRSTDELT